MLKFGLSAAINKNNSYINLRDGYTCLHSSFFHILAELTDHDFVCLSKTYA